MRVLRDISLFSKPLDFVIGAIAYILLAGVKVLGVERASNLGARLVPLFMLLPNKVSKANLKIAFPEKNEAERKAILRASLNNLLRSAFEYPTIDLMWKTDGQSSFIESDTLHIFEKLRDDNQGALIFAAHLANFELPAIAANAIGLEATLLFRMPNNPYLARAIYKIRAKTMGHLVAAGRDGMRELARSLEHGSHIGMLLDQRLSKGVRVKFFNQEVTANPMLARLARLYNVPVHGVRVVRLEGAKFKLEVTEALDLPRDENGKIDVEASTQMITSMIETWVKENPEQWLWLHRRFRL